MLITAIFALLTGVIIFAVWVKVRNMKIAALKRKKTTFAMLRVSSDQRQDGSDEEGVGPVTVASAKPAPAAVAAQAVTQAHATPVAEAYEDEQAEGAEPQEPAEEDADSFPIDDSAVDTMEAPVSADDDEYDEAVEEPKAPPEPRGGKKQPAPKNAGRAEDEGDADADADIGVDVDDDEEEDTTEGGVRPLFGAMPTTRRRVPETVRMMERHVLLAEDVQVNRELIGAFFEGSGVKFKFAANGLEACELFEANPSAFSMILMDVQMPVMDGHDAALRIREHESDWAKQIPIIAMTAADQKEDIDRSFDAGMDDHVTKPVDMDALQNKIFEYIMNTAEE